MNPLAQVLAAFGANVPPLTPQQRVNNGFVPYGSDLGFPLTAGQVVATQEPVNPRGVQPTPNDNGALLAALQRMYGQR